MRRKAKLGWTFSTANRVLPYWYFEHVLWQTLGARIAAREFDVVHRLTPLSPTTPSVIAGRCAQVGARFVWGPINGGIAWPKPFRSRLSAEGDWLSYVRDAHMLIPGFHATRRHASSLIVGSQATWEQMPDRYLDRCVYMPENAIDPARFALRVDRPIARPIRLAFVGRLVPYKGADMLIDAAEPLLRSGDVALDILGDGPERGRLEQLIRERDLGASVSMPGWVEHTALQERLSRSDVFAFPSIREFGGGVVLEAMALGLMPIVVDYGGPRELVTTSTGYRVPMAPRDALVRELRQVLARLVARPETIRPMGEVARARVMSLYTWQAKARQTREIYRWVLGERDKPRFDFEHDALPDFAAPADGLEAARPRPGGKSLDEVA